MPWDFVALIGILGVVVPWRGAVQMRRLLRQPMLSGADRLLIYASTVVFQWLLAGVTAWRCAARHLGSVELGLTLQDPSLAASMSVGLAVPLVLYQLLSLRRLSRLPASRRGFMGEIVRRLLPQNALESSAFAGVAATAAVCEEFIYRGFVIAGLLRATNGSMAAAVVGSSTLFAIGHIYQGGRGVAASLLLGVLFAVVRLWSGSLVPPVIAHLAVDMTAGLFAARVLAARVAGEAEGAAASSSERSSEARAGEK